MLAPPELLRKRHIMKLLAQSYRILLGSLAVLGGLAIIALMMHVVVDVVMRNAANKPIPATYEIVTHYYMIALAFVPLAWVERGGGMVQVEVIDSFLGPTALRLSNMLVALISTVIYGALAWFTLKTAIGNYHTGTFILAQKVSVPTWPAYFFLPIGFALAALVTFSRLFQSQTESHTP